MAASSTVETAFMVSGPYAQCQTVRTYVYMRWQMAVFIWNSSASIILMLAHLPFQANDHASTLGVFELPPTDRSP